MNNLKNFKKVWMNSLSFLDNSMIQSVIAIVLVLYCSTIFDNINSFIGNLYNFSIIKLVILLLIVYISPKDTTIAILLALSYVISLSYMVNNEYFTPEPCPDGGNRKENGMCDKKCEDGTFVDEDMMCPEDMNGMNIKCPDGTMVNRKEDCEGFRNTKEHFFPMQNNDETSVNFKPMVNRQIMKNNDATSVNFDPMVNRQIMQNNINEEIPEKIDYEQSCMQTYTPMFESVGNVCSPTATFKNELNAQGLNYPEGFDHSVNGSPLN